jgi:membrane protein implicated in regulation of membrane protease activity
VWVQLLLFAGLSTTLLLMFRARLLRSFQVNPQLPPVDELVGGVGVVVVAMAPDGIGKVELRGASWTARNTSASVLGVGERARVVRVDGLTLHVGPEGAR